jgi:hypothetical protein
VEIFVGPAPYFNTFSADTDGRPVRPVVRAIIDPLLAQDGHRERPPSNDNDRGEFGRTSELGKRAKNVDAFLAALTMIPNDKHIGRGQWVDIGMSVYSGTGGAERGREAFLEWSATWNRFGENPKEHQANAEKLWDSFASSPPKSIGAGTVFALAKQHGWTWPKTKPAQKGTDELPGQEFDDIEFIPPEDFVEGLLTADSLAMVYGSDGAGKTFFVLDLLVHVAWGRTWFGLEVDQGPSMLFGLESTSNIGNRAVALRQHRQLHGKNLPFRLITDSVDLSDRASVDQIIRTIKRYSRKCGQPVRIVAIDTLAAALTGKGDENSAETMNPVLANCHRIRQETGVCLLLVHHPGKNSRQGPRGFSGIRATLSTLIEIEGEYGKPKRVTVRKQRDLDLGPDRFFRLRPVILGANHRGKPVTSLVVVPITDAAELAEAQAATVAARLTKKQRLGLDALHDALASQGKPPLPGHTAARVVTYKHWLAVFRSRLPPDTPPNTSGRALRRIRDQLVEIGLIGTDGRFVWLQRQAASAVNGDGE